MTEELYYKNQYETDFAATVKKCEKVCEDKYELILDKTAFFPEQGGQYADEGTINGVAVLDVKKRDDDIVHIVGVPFEPGATVMGNVNFEKRFDRMQNHTGEHIVCGIIHNVFGYDNVGFHLSDDELTMDTSGELSEDDLKRIEEMANDVVFRNVPITVLYPSPEELQNIEYRAKLDLKEGVRLVKIEGVDICACCAPHVNSTGEVGLIKIVKSMRWKGGMRLFLACGKRAYKDYSTKHDQIKKISQITNTKPEEVVQEVETMNEKLAILRKELSEARLFAAKNQIDTIADENVILRADLDMNGLREAVNYGMTKKDGIVFIFSGTDESGYSFVLSSKTKDVSEVAKKLFESMNARGGGRNNMITGTVKESEQRILYAIQALI